MAAKLPYFVAALVSDTPGSFAMLIGGKSSTPSASVETAGEASVLVHQWLETYDAVDVEHKPFKTKPGVRSRAYSPDTVKKIRDQIAAFPDDATISYYGPNGVDGNNSGKFFKELTLGMEDVAVMKLSFRKVD